MGSGKTTLAKWFSSAWGIPHIEIDHFRSRDDVIHHVTCDLPSGWVAEANPWQIPREIWSEADWIIFLDFDNIVNYSRLLRRGLERWRSDGQTWNSFRKHVIDDAIRDLCRLVYLYGESNRDGWRSDGMSDDESCPSDNCLRCISPAEVKLLCTNVIPKWTPST